MCSTRLFLPFTILKMHQNHKLSRERAPTVSPFALFCTTCVSPPALVKTPPDSCRATDLQSAVTFPPSVCEQQRAAPRVQLRDFYFVWFQQESRTSCRNSAAAAASLSDAIRPDNNITPALDLIWTSSFLWLIGMKTAALNATVIKEQ